MSEPVKKTIALLAAAALIGIAYYGSFLPMRKSQAFIAVLRSAGAASSLDQLLSMFGNVFAMPSPIGQEELVRNFAGTAVGIISSQNIPPQAVDALTQFVDDSFQPILNRGKGLSFTQNLYTLGNMDQIAFYKTRDPKYLGEAQQMYEKGLRLAPKRPQFLYGLLDVYRMEGNAAGVQSVGNEILVLWQDQRVAKSMSDFAAAYAQQQNNTSTRVKK